MTAGSPEHGGFFRRIVDHFTKNERAVRDVKILVDTALATAYPARLQTGGEGENEFINFFLTRGRLTTSGSNLNSVEGETNDFLDSCDALSGIVQSALTQSNVTSKLKNTGVHSFIIVRHEGVNVYIDAAMGEFVAGFNQIFVGTKKDLRRLIKASHRERKIINIGRFSDPDVTDKPLPPNPTPNQILRKIWKA